MGHGGIRHNFEPGEQASFAKTVTEADVATLAGLIGDFSPPHGDASYGRRTAHAILSEGLIWAVLGNRLPGPGSVTLSQQTEFLAPVYVGDTVTATVEVLSWRADKRIIILKTDCHNQDGKQVVTGKAVLLVNRPGR